MANRLTKIATVAALTLTAAAPMAMAYGVAPNGNSNIVSVAALGPQPDMVYQAMSTSNTNNAAADQVRIAELGPQPEMPLGVQSNGSASVGVVTTGNLSLNAQNTH